MKPLDELPVQGIQAVFTDLDDTLTDAGRIEPRTYQALHDLKQLGLKLVVVSGRPAGWADALMRLWPLDAMIFENGAGIIIREGNKLRAISLASEKSLVEQRKILGRIWGTLQTLVPQSKLATDQPYRLYDFAIDYAEEPPFLKSDEVESLMNALSSEIEITAKLSSIHINFWYGSHTKITACRHLLTSEKAFQGIGIDHVVFCGDSPNDEPLFEFFPNGVGVANVKKLLSRMRHQPAYLAKAEGGAGFVELATRLLTQAR